MKKQLTIWGLSAVMMCGMNSCSCRSAHDDDADRQREEGTERGDVIPQKPDYGDASQWYSVNRGGTGDLFYITSTETGDYLLSDGTMCHYADTYRDSLRLPLTSEMEGVDQILSGGLNFHAPYYRQCSLQSFTSDSLTAARLPLATADVRQALDYYLKHINTNRPFILADNSVRDASCAIWSRSAVCINPVNWRTDDTPATLDTEPSPFVPLDQQQKDHLTVALDPASNLLLVKGYTATDYMLPLIGKEGNYHSREIWLYRQQLCTNMQLRIKNAKE